MIFMINGLERKMGGGSYILNITKSENMNEHRKVSWGWGWRYKQEPSFHHRKLRASDTGEIKQWRAFIYLM